MSTKHTPEPLLREAGTIYRLADDPDPVRKRRINTFHASVQPDSRLMTGAEGEALAEGMVEAYNATIAAGLEPSAIAWVVEALEEIARESSIDAANIKARAALAALKGEG